MRKRWWIILVLIVLAAGGGGYWAYTRLRKPAPAETQPTLQTATVTQGDIVVTADGTGNLLPATEVNVAFLTSGVLKDLLVQVGDHVKKGDLLARLDDTEAREAVREAEITLRLAEIDIQMAQNEADAGIAQANLEVAEAAYAEAAALAAHTSDQLASARIGLAQAAAALAEAQQNYQAAFDTARDWELGSRGATSLKNEREAAAAALANAQYELELAQANYNVSVASTDRTSVQNAKINVLNAQLALTNLPAEGEQLQLALEKAQMALAAAQRTLEQTTLLAPVSGTVMSVDAQVGEQVAGGSAIIVLANLDQPLIRFWVEETDLTSVQVGNRVTIVFEALPDLTYHGEIVRVDPELVEVDTTTGVQVYASIDPSEHAAPLFSGMTAEVEVVAGEARGALLVPVEALRELPDGGYAVFVVQSDGTLELRPVEVGLKDYVNAEIRSGLQAGEVVSLASTTTSAQTSEGERTMPPGPGFFFGG